MDTRNPKDLSEALEYALHVEERQKYAEKSKAVASSFHVSRRDSIVDHPTSPFSKQMTFMDNRDKKVPKESQRPTAFEPGNFQLPNGL